MPGQTDILQIPYSVGSDAPPSIEEATRPPAERIEELFLARATRRETHTWAIGGEIRVPSGDTDFIPGMDAAKLANETLRLKKLRGAINSGTSVTLKFQKNGVDVSGYTGLTVDTVTDDLATGDVTIADNDVLTIVVTAVSGTPKNMRVTAVFDRELTA